MSKSLLRFSGIAFLTVCLCVRPVAAYVIPIASIVEWPQEIMLLVESEMKRWSHEATKYKEMLLSDMTGRLGGGSLGDNPVVTQLVKSAKDGSSSVGKAIEEVSLQPVVNGQKNAVIDLTNYAAAKAQIANSYIIEAKKGTQYTEQKLAEIMENQRAAINDMAEAGLALAASQNVGANIGKSESEPDKRAENIADAKDVTAMYEMMLVQNRKIYERALRSSAVEATKAGIRSMQGLTNISKAGIGKGKV